MEPFFISHLTAGQTSVRTPVRFLSAHRQIFFLGFNNYLIVKLCSDKIHRIPLDDKGIALWMAETVDFKINIKVWPFYCIWTRHLDIQHTTNWCILHPRNTIIRKEIIASLYGNHNSLCINHQYAYHINVYSLSRLNTGLISFVILKRTTGQPYVHLCRCKDTKCFGYTSG